MPMKVRGEFSRLKQTSWKEYAVRFVFGGVITALTGWIAHQYGPVVGGLFLAFPAILPASVTLVAEHEGRRAAGVDAAGAVLGSAGLLAFAGLIWGLAARAPAAVVLIAALIVWFALSAGLWWGRERWKRRRHRERERARGEHE